MCVLLLYPVFANCLVSGLQFFIHVVSFLTALSAVIWGKYVCASSLFVFIFQFFWFTYKVTNFQRDTQIKTYFSQCFGRQKQQKTAENCNLVFQMLYLCTCKSETGTALRATRPIYFVRVFDKFAIVNRRRNINKENRENIIIYFYLLMFYSPQPTKQQNN